MKRFAILAFALSLSGCIKPAVEACNVPKACTFTTNVTVQAPTLPPL